MNTTANHCCRTAHHHHYHHHHHRIGSSSSTVRNSANANGAATVNSSSNANGSGNSNGYGGKVSMARTMDALNYWKRAFSNAEDANGGGMEERMFRLGGAPASRQPTRNGIANALVTSAAAAPNQKINDCFPVTKERKVSVAASVVGKSACKFIRAKNPLLKTLSPIQNSPNFLDSPIALITQRKFSSEVEHQHQGQLQDQQLKPQQQCENNGENFLKANNNRFPTERYDYGIDELADERAVESSSSLLGYDNLGSELETDACGRASAATTAAVQTAAERKRKVSPTRRAANNKNSGSQLETTATVAAAVAAKPRKTAGAGAAVGTVIGIADYSNQLDYDSRGVMPKTTTVAGTTISTTVKNEYNTGFLKPSVMIHNNNNSNNNKNDTKNNKTSHNNNNFHSSKLNSFNTDMNNKNDAENYHKIADYFNNKIMGNNNDYGIVGGIDAGNYGRAWMNVVDQQQFDNNIHGHAVFNNNSNTYTNNNNTNYDSDYGSGGGSSRMTTCGSDATVASKSTGIYDDEDGTLVFAIEI